MAAERIVAGKPAIRVDYDIPIPIRAATFGLWSAAFRRAEL